MIDHNSSQGDNFNPVITILIMLPIFFALIFMGITIFEDNRTINEYQSLAVDTCSYANNLTEIINLQSDTLEMHSTSKFDRLEYLNCSKLIVSDRH